MGLPGTGTLGLPMMRLAKMLSHCSTAQTMLAVGTADDAYDLIYWPAFFLEDDATALAAEYQTEPIPSFTVSQLDDPGWEQEISRGDAVVGVLYAELRMKPSATGESTMRDQVRHFTNRCGAILDELWALSATVDPDGGQFLQITDTIKTLASPQFTFQDDEADQSGLAYLAAAFAVMYQT